MRYDVHYITPAGYPGTAVGIEAPDEESAKQKGLYVISLGAPWPPEQFKITGVTECTCWSPNE